MEEQKKTCPVCGTETSSYINHGRCLASYHCPVCGMYQVGAYWREHNHFDMNHLAAFLAHNAYNPADDLC